MTKYVSFKVVNKDSGKVLFERVYSGASDIPYQSIIDALDFLYCNLPHIISVSFESFDKI